MSIIDDSDHTKIVGREETLKTFMQNPLGGGSSFQNRKLIADGLFNNFLKLIKKNKKFKVRVYDISNDVYIQVLVPSETIDNFYYDVVIKFITGTNKVNLVNCNIQVFSNSPSFVFTYAYAYNNDNLLIDELKDKLHKKSLTEIPKVKNTELVTGYEKTIFYALFYIEQENLLMRSMFANMILRTNKEQMRRLIDNSEKKLIEYNSKKGTNNKVTTVFIDVNDEKLNNRRRIYNKNSIVNSKVKNKVTNSKVNSNVNNKINNKVNNKVNQKKQET